MYILPSISLRELPSMVLRPRQATSSLPTGGQPTSGCPGQYSGGTLAGAILGTFFGTLLILYLFSVIQPTLFGSRTEEVIVERKVRSSNSGSRRRSRRSGSHA